MRSSSDSARTSDARRDSQISSQLGLRLRVELVLTWAGPKRYITLNDLEGVVEGGTGLRLTACLIAGIDNLTVVWHSLELVSNDSMGGEKTHLVSL